MNPESLVAPAGCGGRLGGGYSLLLDRDGVGGPLCRCHGSRIYPSDQDDKMKDENLVGFRESVAVLSRSYPVDPVPTHSLKA